MNQAVVLLSSSVASLSRGNEGHSCTFGNSTQQYRNPRNKIGVFDKIGLCVVPLLQEQPSEVKVGNEVRGEVSIRHLRRLYITFVKSLLQYFKNMSPLRGSVNDFFFLSPGFIRGYKYTAPTGLASLFGNFTEHVKISALLEVTKKNGGYEKHGLCVAPLLQEQPSELKVRNEVLDEVSIQPLRETFYLTKQ
jgi:hypothetical protein